MTKILHDVTQISCTNKLVILQRSYGRFGPPVYYCRGREVNMSSRGIAQVLWILATRVDLDWPVLAQRRQRNSRTCPIAVIIPENHVTSKFVAHQLGLTQVRIWADTYWKWSKRINWKDLCCQRSPKCTEPGLTRIAGNTHIGSIGNTGHTYRHLIWVVW